MIKKLKSPPEDNSHTHATSGFTFSDLTSLSFKHSAFSFEDSENSFTPGMSNLKRRKDKCVRVSNFGSFLASSPLPPAFPRSYFSA